MYYFNKKLNIFIIKLKYKYSQINKNSKIYQS